ncbi:hypothetical protein FE257_004043 [Aspergillus nanangensis]|uniref:PCI domain-containing protein n=1 Tax=Aspergillus nanangensis TaxID=2582783 RepID=A0AAD4CC71_ASPNN|nr:hypothetical protein FE257_004043 [Aspergillus nanangensis]
MNQAHTRAMEALQPFVHLATSTNAASPKFISNLITNATSSPNTYVFGELLETPAIQALRSTDTPAEFQGHLTLLEIFAWGTWQDYQATPNLPPLNAEQTQKLRLLSLLSFSTTINPITYTSLMDALSITAPAELESLVTAAIYSSLITARLSPATSPPTVNVTSVAPLRDVKPQSLSTMIMTLTQWETRCGDVIGDIEAEIANIKANAAKRRANEHARSVLFEKTLADFNNNNHEGGTGSRKHGAWQKGVGGPGGNVGNKREFNADDFDEDDGFWEQAPEGFDGYSGVGSRMDIDEGSGFARMGMGTTGSRHAKRVLGKKS